MRKLSKAVLALCMAMIMAMLLPVQAFADSSEYISEVKIGMGKTVDEAAKALEGYTILKYNGEYADLNKSAGAGLAGGKGQKAVLLGYKTTRSRDDAITDLALMNMKGDYSIQNYEMMIELALEGEIRPFIDKFLVAIQEYRDNYNSDIPENRARAEYFHDGLNRLIDDDTGMGMGDLLLNETKYEMGDAAYNKLSAAQKKQHGDILTVFLQSNGKALALINILIAWSTDTNEDNWLQRFSNLTYDDMLDELDMSPSDAKRYLKKEYEDDARKILALWSDFQEQLENYDETLEVFEEKSANDEEIEELNSTMEDIDLEKSSEDEIDDYAEAVVKLTTESEILRNAAADVEATQCLEEISYEDGTMLDFFMQDYADVEDDLTMLFPLVASLSDGQRASLGFLSLSELVRMTEANNEGFSEVNFDDIDETSVYLGVDRSIFGMSGIAATKSALKNNAATEQRDPLASQIWDGIFEKYNQINAEMIGIAMGLVKIGTNAWKLISIGLAISTYGIKGVFQYSQISTISTVTLNAIKSHLSVQLDLVRSGAKDAITTVKESSLIDRINQSQSMFNHLMNAVSYALIIYTAYSIYSTWNEIHDYYDIEFTPAPRYIVDVADLMTYNAKGEKVLIGNVTSYYNAVTCNRTKSDEMFEPLNDIADMNGDVGRQWLALYAAKNRATGPIIANSFVVKMGENGNYLPAGYNKGIHTFGTTAALDLNTTNFDWTHGEDGIYVYFKTDDSAATTGSVFSSGVIAIAAVGGVVIGSVATAIAMTTKRKKENQLQTVN